MSFNSKWRADHRSSIPSLSEGYFSFASGDKNYLLVMKYKGILNPSKVKLKFRGLKQLIEDGLYLEVQKSHNVLNENSARPFKDITDEEMDNLFSFSEV